MQCKNLNLLLKWILILILQECPTTLHLLTNSNYPNLHYKKMYKFPHKMVNNNNSSNNTILLKLTHLIKEFTEVPAWVTSKKIRKTNKICRVAFLSCIHRPTNCIYHLKDLMLQIIAAIIFKMVSRFLAMVNPTNSFHLITTMFSPKTKVKLISQTPFQVVSVWIKIIYKPLLNKIKYHLRKKFPLPSAVN